jgi:hypothetical protein
MSKAIFPALRILLPPAVLVVPANAQTYLARQPISRYGGRLLTTEEVTLAEIAEAIATVSVKTETQHN